MSEIEIEFCRSEDDEPVIALVTYNYVRDFDFVPYGESEVRRDTSFIEIIDAKYTVKGIAYEPTDYERKYWEKDLEREVAREIA